MKLRLTDGTIVEAEKDCRCVTHEGPHWIHMDDLWKSMNRDMLQASPRGFIAEECARLRQKAYDMKFYGIAEIIRS